MSIMLRSGKQCKKHGKGNALLPLNAKSRPVFYYLERLLKFYNNSFNKY